MSSSNTLSTADMADRHRQLFALAMLGASLIYLGKAAEHLAPEAMADYLDYATVGLALLVVGSLLPAFVAKFRLPSDQKLVYFSESGYVAQLLRRAFKASWAATFISFVGLEFVARDNLVDLPAVFFIQAGLFIMLSVMSVTFLVLNWNADRDAAGDDV
jgi:hypothetical protein